MLGELGFIYWVILAICLLMLLVTHIPSVFTHIVLKDSVPIWLMEKKGSRGSACPSKQKVKEDHRKSSAVSYITAQERLFLLIFISHFSSSL